MPYTWFLMMQQLESGTLAMSLARRAVAYLAADPQNAVDKFLSAVRELRNKNGRKAPYDTMEHAARRDWTQLRDLLLADGPDADLVRSMAPFYAIVPNDERIQVIREMRPMVW
jgi:hypothetical protein